MKIVNMKKFLRMTLIVFVIIIGISLYFSNVSFSKGDIKTKTVTLNLELIKRDLKYLDYVIVHELSHLIEANHSKAFWALVEENCKDYKKYRKEMKDF